MAPQSGGGQMNMMEMCGSMMSKFMERRPGVRFLFAIPGLALVAAGVLIFTAPMILVWFAAVALIVIGALSFSVPILIRRIAARSARAISS
jgi:hypothetical protein